MPMRYGVLFLVALAAATCMALAPRWLGSEVPFRDLEGNYYYPAPEGECRLVFTTQREWEAWWDSSDAFHSSPHPDAPAVDFEHGELVIVVGSGACPTGGYGIGISSIRESNDSLDVYVREERPDRRQPVTCMVTYPCHVVFIGGVGKQVRFIDDGPQALELARSGAFGIFIAILGWLGYVLIRRPHASGHRTEANELPIG